MLPHILLTSLPFLFLLHLFTNLFFCFKIPPLGELKYPNIDMVGTYYAVRNKAIASWLPCRVIETMDVVISGQKSVKYYKVKYLRIKVPTVKCVSAKHMAYGDPPSVRLSIGAVCLVIYFQ